MTSCAAVAELASRDAEDNQDIDRELAELFDADTDDEPEKGQFVVPESPPPLPADDICPARAPRRGILDVLLENKDRLSGRVADIVNDAEDAIARRTGDVHTSSVPAAETEPSAPTMASLMRERREKRRAGQLGPASATGLNPEQQRKKARNAFKVFGRQAARSDPSYKEYADSLFTNMRLCNAVYSQEGLKGIFEHCVRVDIAELAEKSFEVRSGRLGEFVVFGCLVEKHSKKTTKDGRKFAVWTISNMPLRSTSREVKAPPLTSVNVLIFDDAFDNFHMQVEGSVFAFRKPTLLPPRGQDSQNGDSKAKNRHDAWSGYCLKVNKSSNVIPLGVCKTYRVCDALVGSQGMFCGAWFHSTLTSLCARHAREKLKRQMHGTRMDVNNAERPGAGKEVFNGLADGRNISSVDGPMLHNRYHTEHKAKNEYDAYREKTDAEKTLRLSQARKNLGGDTTWGGQVAEAPKRAFSETLKLDKKKKAVAAEFAENMRPEFGDGQALALNRKFSQKRKEGLQPMYKKAVDALLKCGFALQEDGALLPPQTDQRKKLDIRLLRGKHPRACTSPSARRRTSSSQIPVSTFANAESSASGEDNLQQPSSAQNQSKSSLPTTEVVPPTHVAEPAAATANEGGSQLELSDDSESNDES